MELSEYLIELIKLQGSDLYISSGAPPMAKVEGKTHPLTDQLIDVETAHNMVYSILSDSQILEFEQNLELNMALHIPDAGRFRVNVFKQRGETALVARYIKSHIPSIEDLGLPQKLKEFISEQRGLLLVVGGTGTGKSTTLASMIDYRAQQQCGHILCIEDPIEFIHQHRQSMINQREVGLDTHSYADALVNAMREAPDVIMIGEIRDAATMKHALTYAETGHLCVSTLHANNADQTLDRILNFFPHEAHDQILMDMSLHLKAIVAQRLCVGVDGKRVATVEMMINTPHISDLIQKGKIDEIKHAMGQSHHLAHQTFDNDLYNLALNGKISQEEALRHADSRNNVALRFRLEQNKFATEETPEKKEISYNKKAPFEQYRRFRVRPLKVSRDRRPDQVDVLTKALSATFKAKGLQYDREFADIEVQYVFGLEKVEGLKLEIIENRSDEIADITADSDKDATLIVNIRDLKSNKDVWRLNVVERISGPLMDQQTINTELERILEEYPPK